MAEINLDAHKHLTGDPAVYLQQLELLFEINPVLPDEAQVKQWLEIAGAPEGFYKDDDLTLWAKGRYYRSTAQVPLEYDMFGLHGLLLDPAKPWGTEETGFARTFRERLMVASDLRLVWLKRVLPAQQNREAQKRWRERNAPALPEVQRVAAEAVKVAHAQWIQACGDREAAMERLKMAKEEVALKLEQLKQCRLDHQRVKDNK